MTAIAFRARAASCTKCACAVVAATDRCPWCDELVTPDSVIDTTMDAALETTTLFHLTLRAEPIAPIDIPDAPSESTGDAA